MTDLKSVWKNRTIEENRMIAISELRARADRFQAHVRLRNVIFYAYAAFNIGVSIWLIATGRLSAFLYPMLLMIAAHLFVLWQVNRRIGSRPLPGDSGARPVLDVYRDELRRQADGLKGAWLWYIAPFMPPFLWELAIWVQRYQAGVARWDLRTFLFTIFGAVCFWTAVWLAFSRASIRLQLKIERLNALKAE